MLGGQTKRNTMDCNNSAEVNASGVEECVYSCWWMLIHHGGVYWGCTANAAICRKYPHLLITATDNVTKLTLLRPSFCAPAVDSSPLTLIVFYFGELLNEKKFINVVFLVSLFPFHFPVVNQDRELVAPGWFNILSPSTPSSNQIEK